MNYGELSMNRIPSPTLPERERASDRAAAESEQLRGERTPREEERYGTRALRPDDGRERMRAGNANVNPFQMDDILARYPDTDFNWKRYEVSGKPDFAEQRMYQDQGWRNVLHEQFPGRFAPEGTSGPVIVKDMILMERPMRLTLQARREEMEAANRAMTVHRQQMSHAPEGQAPRMAPSIRTSREAIQIPDD
jgi:hypothetical protein